MSMRPSGIYSTNYVEDQAIWRTRVDRFWTVVLVVVAVVLPLLSASGPLGLQFVPETLLGILTDGGILLISIVGLNLLLGYTGQISLGQAAFMMVGAYSSAVLTRQSGVPFLLALPLSAFITGIVGLFFGLASLRVKGFYLAMATLAAQFIIPWAISSFPDSNFLNADFGGDVGLTVPAATIFGVTLNSNSEEYYLVLFFAVFMWLIARNLVRSRVGRAWIAIRDNDLAAEQLGINVFRFKVMAFYMSAVYAGVAGCLLAHVKRTISPAGFEITESIEMLGMLVIGGAGFPLGPVFGVMFFLFIERWFIDVARDVLIDILPYILTFRERADLETALQAGLPPLLFGLFLAIFLIFQPRGLAYRWMILQAAWRLRPFSKA